MPIHEQGLYEGPALGNPSARASAAKKMVILGGTNAAGRRRVPGEMQSEMQSEMQKAHLTLLPAVKAKAVREVAPPFCDLTTGTDDLFPKSGGDMTCSSRRCRASPPRSNLWATMVYQEGFGQVSLPR